MSQQVLTISQINEYIKRLIDNDTMLVEIAVKGEISNYKVYPSGHHYFTLKDESSSLRCVMFKGNAMRLRFRPENGMQIIAMGRISVYPRDGGYQLYCSAMAMDGIGDLYAAFEQLKTKLAAQGLFDPTHKKPLPAYPGVIGLVTSSAGAAIHDMIRVINKRYPLTKIKLLPVRVQGREAPAEIAGAIAYANQKKLADLLIVGRGGGSIEDLWAFNDEMVAHAIYNSEIPIISAVGHEPDITISDYVADLRAATPSNAAELAVPDQDALRQHLDAVSDALLRAITQKVQGARKQLSILSSSSSLRGPTQYIQLKKNTVENLQNRLVAGYNQNVSRKRRSFVALTAKLDAMSPLKVLTRGYAMAQIADGPVIRSVEQVNSADLVDIRVEDGTFRASVIDKRSNHNEQE